MMNLQRHTQPRGGCNSSYSACRRSPFGVRLPQRRSRTVLSSTASGATGLTKAPAPVVRNNIQWAEVTVAGPPGPATRFMIPDPLVYEAVMVRPGLSAVEDMAGEKASLKAALREVEAATAMEEAAFQLACDARDAEIEQMRRVLELQQLGAAQDLRTVFRVKHQYRQIKALLAQQLEALELALQEAAAAQAAEAAAFAAWKEFQAQRGVEMQGVPVWWDEAAATTGSSSMVGVGVTASTTQQQQQEVAGDDGLWRPLEEVVASTSSSNTAASTSSGAHHSSSSSVPLGSNSFDAFLQQTHQQLKKQAAMPPGWGLWARYSGCLPLAVRNTSNTSSTSTAVAATSSTSSSTADVTSSTSSTVDSSHNSSHISSSSADLAPEGGLLRDQVVNAATPDAHHAPLVSALADKGHALGTLLRAVCRQGVKLARSVPTELQKVSGFVAELCGSSTPDYVLTSHSIDLTTDEDEEVVSQVEMASPGVFTTTTSASSSSSQLFSHPLTTSSSKAAAGDAPWPLAAAGNSSSSSSSSSSSKGSKAPLRGGYASAGSSWDEGDATAETQQQQQQHQPQQPRGKGSGRRRRSKRNSSRHSDRLGRGFGV